METRGKNGVLLVNLGSPDAPNVPAVRRYLREFLMDPRVIDLPALGRWLLVHGIILPLRPRKSAKAYQKVWTDKGSPLIVSGFELKKAVAEALDGEAEVELAMRYGNPSLRSGIDSLMAKGCERLVIVPLYPQYASATTASIYEATMDVLKSKWSMPAVDFIGDFYDDKWFIEAFRQVAKPQLDDFRPDYVLFSYHGLPVRHLNKAEGIGSYCQQEDKSCCAQVGIKNRFCYRAQCIATTRALSKALGLSEGSYSSSFQSRLGKAEWVKPYTDKTIEELAKKGYKRLAVMCPAFVADCLETIEEIGMEGKNDWLEAGGEDFRLIESLNSHPAWTAALSEMVRETL